MEARWDRLSLSKVENRICDLIAKIGDKPRHFVRPEMSLVEDLGFDSLEIVELMMEVEEDFDVSLPDRPDDPVSKQIFTRHPFRVRDLAEFVYRESRAGRRDSEWTRMATEPRPAPTTAFTQLGGSLLDDARAVDPLYEPLGDGSEETSLFRRSTDGMQCVLVPESSVEIGSGEEGAQADEQPAHSVRLSEFLIDVEPVSTAAFARFLNSIGEIDDDTLRRWFVLAPEDRRAEHMPIKRRKDRWEPFHRAELWPMVLVSWYGANAYSKWANGQDWTDDRSDAMFLPSDAQWEYAARGATRRRFPWGEEEPTPEMARLSLHRWGTTYSLASLPLANVNEELGLSPFGLRHMAGNVWHWCRDDYDPKFYSTDAAKGQDPVCRSSTGVKSERGGSWIGPADLARSSYRRGRPPLARGRCLGFRCVGHVET